MGFHERLCPTCGKPRNEPHISVDTTTGIVACGTWGVELPRRQAMVLDALVKAYPGGLTRERVVSAVYDVHHDDHVEWPEEALMSNISHLRQRLRKSGAPFHIVAKRFLGYRLVFGPEE